LESTPCEVARAVSPDYSSPPGAGFRFLGFGILRRVEAPSQAAIREKWILKGRL
jgi:hypothetical protein